MVVSQILIKYFELKQGLPVLNRVSDEPHMTFKSNLLLPLAKIKTGATTDYAADRQRRRGRSGNVTSVARPKTGSPSVVPRSS